MGHFCLPESMKIVDMTRGPVTTNGGITCDYVSLKNAHRAWMVVSLTQGTGHATVIQPQRATGVTPAGATSITVAVPIWSNEDVVTSDLLVRQTDGTVYTVTNDVKKKMIVFQINPDFWPAAGAFDVLGCTLSDSSASDNFASVIVYLEERYPADQPPSAIID